MASRFGYKLPRTTQEMKAALADPDLVRPRRNAKNLPHSYDDLPARQPRTDNYKNHRRSK